MLVVAVTPRAYKYVSGSPVLFEDYQYIALVPNRNFTNIKVYGINEPVTISELNDESFIKTNADLFGTFTIPSNRRYTISSPYNIERNKVTSDGIQEMSRDTQTVKIGNLYLDIYPNHMPYVVENLYKWNLRANDEPRTNEPCECWTVCHQAEGLVCHCRTCFGKNHGNDAAVVAVSAAQLNRQRITEYQRLVSTR